jgi:hypothetical protein
MNGQPHTYIVRSVSEYLAEFYPSFGSHLLEWIARICEASVNAVGGLASGARLCPQSSYLRVPRYGGPRESSTTSLPGPASAYQDGVMITGLSHVQKLTLVVSAESMASMLEIKSALAWILAVLQYNRRTLKASSILLWTKIPWTRVYLLDKGIPESAEFTQRLFVTAGQNCSATPL